MKNLAPDLLILGLGNVLCGDDSVGIEAVRRLVQCWELPEEVAVLDGGTLGFALMSLLAETPEVWLVDAVMDGDQPAGQLVRLTGEEVGRAARERLSVHQVGVADLLEGLRWIDRYPQKLQLFGVVPATLELGLERSPQVEAALPALVDAVIAELRTRGFAVSPREIPHERPFWEHPAHERVALGLP